MINITTMCADCPNLKICRIVDSDYWAEQYQRCLKNGNPINHIQDYLDEQRGK